MQQISFVYNNIFEFQNQNSLLFKFNSKLKYFINYGKIKNKAKLKDYREKDLRLL